MLVLLSICFLQLITISGYVLGNSNSSEKRLQNHKEIHEAKNPIDALSYKLPTKLQHVQRKSANLKLESNEYFSQGVSTEREIKTLNKLKQLLNDITKKGRICEKFYTSFDFLAVREIKIHSAASLPKDYTVSFQGNLRLLFCYV